MKLLSSLSKTLRVLESFSEERQQLSTIELSRLLDMDKSSVSRIVMTLTHHGYLNKSQSTGKYYLGAKFIDLGNQVLHRFDQLDIGDIAAPYLHELSEKIKETVHLAVLDNREVVTIKKMDGRQIVKVDTKVGRRYPAYACALGKVLLGGLSELEFKKTMEGVTFVPRTPNTIESLPALIDELERVRKQGYAYEDEESFPGICCAAAPVKNYKGRVLAAVSATVPKQRMDASRLKEIVLEIKECGEKISGQIG